MKKKIKKLAVTAFASILLVAGAFGVSNIVTAAANPCQMVKVADLGRCNLSANCTASMSRYVCGNHSMCTHADTKCTNGHIVCSNPVLH